MISKCLLFELPNTEGLQTNHATREAPISTYIDRGRREACQKGFEVQSICLRLLCHYTRISIIHSLHYFYFITQAQGVKA
jgi:hypothetical protein